MKMDGHISESVQEVYDSHVPIGFVHNKIAVQEGVGQYRLLAQEGRISLLVASGPRSDNPCVANQTAQHGTTPCGATDQL